MTVRSEVGEALENVAVPTWKRALVLSLAEAMDESPSASTAKELRSLMDELVTAPIAKGDVADDLGAKRAERRRAASS